MLLPTIAAMTPSQLFGRYYQQQHGAEPDEQVVALFNQLFEEVSGGAPVEA